MKTPISKSIVKRLQAQSTAPKFREVYQAWLAQGVSRKRDPFRPATVATYKSQIETNVLPVIGDFPIDTVGNKALNLLTEKLHEKHLSAATIARNINNIKSIRKFLKNDDGQPLYPYVWDAETIDAPIVSSDDQKRPKASAQAVQETLSKAPSHVKALVALLAGSGLRIREAMALRLDPDDRKSTVWIPSESKIIVRQQREARVFGTTKTSAGQREVDLSPELNDYLLKVLGNEYLLTLNGNPDNLVFPGAVSNYSHILRNLGFKIGFHSLRRFRVTYLRLQGVPESLIKFWIGHKDSTITGLYTEVGPEIAARKTQAQRAGLGFEL